MLFLEKYQREIWSIVTPREKWQMLRGKLVVLGGLVDENGDLVGIPSGSVFKFYGEGGVISYSMNLLGSLQGIVEQYQ